MGKCHDLFDGSNSELLPDKQRCDECIHFRFEKSIKGFATKARIGCFSGECHHPDNFGYPHLGYEGKMCDKFSRARRGDVEKDVLEELMIKTSNCTVVGWASRAANEIVRLRARVAELEAQAKPPNTEITGEQKRSFCESR